MNSIVLAALVGAAGGLIGGGIAWLIEKALGRRPKWVGVIPIAAVAASITGYQASRPTPIEEALSEMDRLPNVQALKTYYPADYATLEQKVRSLPSGASAIEAQNQIRPILGAVMARQMPKASADNAYELVSLVRDEARALSTTHPDACVGLLTTGVANVDLGSVLSAGQKQRDQDLTSRVLTQTATAPAAPASPLPQDQWSALANKALAAVPAAEQPAVVTLSRAGQSAATPDQARAMCDFYLATFDQILSQPRDVAGPLVRGMLATK